MTTRWTDAVLVCGKCSKRVGGGFGADGTTSLAKSLRKRFGWGRKRKSQVGVVEVKCLGVCPKHAVVALNARHPGDWLLVRPGTDLGEVAVALDLIEPARPTPQPEAGSA